MIRIDMSEYMEKHAVSRLIGAPPGYIGFDEGGQLTEAVRRRPYSVLLFDEIEKAHYDVFNVLLQILDDGRLTDSHGRTVDFKNTMVIMTSNIGSQMLINQSEKEQAAKTVQDEQKIMILKELRQHFRPEFLNRVDDTVVFHPLQKEHMKGIIKIQLERLKKRLDERNISLQMAEKTIDICILDFIKFLDCRDSGLTNMFNVTNVMKLTGLSKEQIVYIIKNFDKLEEK